MLHGSIGFHVFLSQLFMSRLRYECDMSEAIWIKLCLQLKYLQHQAIVAHKYYEFCVVFLKQSQVDTTATPRAIVLDRLVFYVQALRHRPLEFLEFR